MDLISLTEWLVDLSSVLLMLHEACVTGAHLCRGWAPRCKETPGRSSLLSVTGVSLRPVFPCSTVVCILTQLFTTRLRATQRRFHSEAGSSHLCCGPPGPQHSLRLLGRHGRLLMKEKSRMQTWLTYKSTRRVSTKQRRVLLKCGGKESFSGRSPSRVLCGWLLHGMKPPPRPDTQKPKVQR